jgi:hypothetical protein
MNVITAFGLDLFKSFPLNLNLNDTLVKVSVSDLETCMDFFAFPGSCCENLNFPALLS